MLTFRTFTLWIHLAAVVVWVGGQFALSLVCVPLLRRGAHSPEEGARLGELLSRRFLRISREVVLFIVLTGVLNIINAGVARGFGFSAAYVEVLVVKAALLAAMVSIQLWQTFRLAPARVARAGSGGVDPSAAKMERRAVAAAVAGLVLSACAILLGLELRYL